MEFHWPGYQYMGPGTHLEKRLARGDPGINRLDRIAKAHDIDYGKAKNLKDKWAADRKMIAKIDQLPGRKTLTERIVKISRKLNSSWACKIVLKSPMFNTPIKKTRSVHTGLMDCFHSQVLVHLLQCIDTNRLHNVLLHRLGLHPVQRQQRQRKGAVQLFLQPVPPFASL